MHRYFTLRVLFESRMYKEYKYRSRNRCWCNCKNKNNNSGLWTLTLRQHCRRVAHAARKNGYTRPFLYGFQVWSDDAVFCAKAKAYGLAGEPRYSSMCFVQFP